MSTINRQIITAAVNVTENDVYSVGDIAAAMLSVMGHEEDWTTEFVREVMCAVIDDMGAEEYADVAAIIIEAARAIMAGAARAEDEHGWVGVDDIEVAFA